MVSASLLSSLCLSLPLCHKAYSFARCMLPLNDSTLCVLQYASDPPLVYSYVLSLLLLRIRLRCTVLSVLSVVHAFVAMSA